MCIDNSTEWLKFGWFSSPPASNEGCLWMNVKDTRTLLGISNYNSQGHENLTTILAVFFQVGQADL